MTNVVMKLNPVTGRERPQETDFNEGRRVVRVLPKNDEIRKYLKHHPSRVGFLAEGSAEWPNDTYTKRRIRDGDVTIEAAPAAGEQRFIEQQKDSKVIDKSGAKAAEKSKSE